MIVWYSEHLYYVINFVGDFSIGLSVFLRYPYSFILKLFYKFIVFSFFL